MDTWKNVEEDLKDIEYMDFLHLGEDESLC
jgi:hypothetical protein